MKIKIIESSYNKVMTLEQPEHQKPIKAPMFMRMLMKTLSYINLRGNDMKYIEHGMERLKKNEPYLLLMNHSSFIDLQIAANYLYPRAFSTVCTTDGYIGKPWLMRLIGCIPTQKYVADIALIKDISYALKKLETVVVMYPEAGYSFDGTATPLPDTLGKLLKLLKVPVVTLITHGAFAREPLYNMLRHRDVKISADVTYLLSPEEIAERSPEELNAILAKEFSFDNFRYQQENDITISEDFRADGLERVLYKCPHCLSEGKNIGKGTTIKCSECGAEYELTEKGALKALNVEGIFDHVPDWYRWEREEVKQEVEEGRYLLDIDVEVMMIVDYKALYRIGDGHLRHDAEGFRLTTSDGELDYSQSSISSYSLNVDYYWYEIGDMISIGNKRHLFYCFPKNQGDTIVAKARLAAEELYKIKINQKRRKSED